MTLPTIKLNKLTSDQRKAGLPVSLNKVESLADKIRNALTLPKHKHSPSLANASIRDGARIYRCDDQGQVYEILIFRSKNRAREYNRLVLSGRAYRAEKLAMVTFKSGAVEIDMRNE